MASTCVLRVDMACFIQESLKLLIVWLYFSNMLRHSHYLLPIVFNYAIHFCYGDCFQLACMCIETICNRLELRVYCISLAPSIFYWFFQNTKEFLFVAQIVNHFSWMNQILQWIFFFWLTSIVSTSKISAFSWELVRITFNWIQI